MDPSEKQLIESVFAGGGGQVLRDLASRTAEARYEEVRAGFRSLRG
jgi:hypothetical protein